MIAQSQSGTGKTAAFVLTMLSRVVVENPWPQVCLSHVHRFYFKDNFRLISVMQSLLQTRDELWKKLE